MNFSSSSQMEFGFCLFSSILVVSLFFNPVCSQEPNTDEYYVSDFLKKMAVTSSQDFNFSAPVCSWQGVFCDAKHVYVIGLVASGLGLSGVIPENTIGKLNKLQSLDLSNNKITSLSSDFWSFGKNLKSLNLSFNQISGELPNNIGNFAGLETLDLSFNSFSGNIPTSLSSLLSVQVLKLAQNLFIGSIPSGILNCQSLVSLDLSSNRLNGTLPIGFSAAFPKLKALNLAGNEIHGRSSVFSGMNSITHLNISSNSFHGSVVGVFQKRLEVIDLSRNYFQGHLSDLHSNPNFNWSHLVVLDISSNQLTGDFSFHDFGEAQSLKHLNLAHNRFSDQELPKVEKLSRLEYLNLSGIGLRGKIPSEITQLSLSTLDLSMNHLTGRIPNLHINNLQVIDLSSNNLTGEVPLLLLENLHQMESFNFSYNNLTLCASELSSEVLEASFIGSVNSCPIAANPDLFRGKPTKHIGLKLSLAVSLSTVCLLVGLLFLAFGCRRKTVAWEAKQQPVSKDEQNMSGPFSFQTDSTTWVADVKVATSVPVVIFEKPLLNITFADLLSATSHFDRGTLLAEGRFGPVYRGFLPGGVHVAVKVLVHVSTMTDEEVARELEYLGRIRHPNLVPLTGYCLAGDQRIAIYEYMENGNLQNLLHDLPLGIPGTEDWSTDTWEEDSNTGIQNVGSEDLLTNWRFRHKIALGTARALAFLHHGCSPSIIHRDVKASSIYLDSNLEPRLSDFGLINGLEDDIPHWSLGYVPPEFCEPETGPPTLKSDVYGFGVVLFELVTGKKPIGDDYSDGKELNLVSWIRGLVRKNKCATAIDPKIRGTGSETEMEEALRIGYLCTADLPTKRPSMHQIVGLLKDIEPVVQQ